MCATQFLSLLALAVANAATTWGQTQCPCIKPEHKRAKKTHVKKDCPDRTWSKTEDIKCIETTVKGKKALYQEDYGVGGCKSYKEPGHPSCFNHSELETVVNETTLVNGSNVTKAVNKSIANPNLGMELPADKKADWCDSLWCYVDDCTCDSADVAESTYFPGNTMYYSYKTCGASDTYTSKETDITSGKGNCATNDAASSSMRSCTMHTWAAISVFLSCIAFRLL